MVYKKPGVTIAKNYLASTTSQESTLPATIIGERYDIFENIPFGTYDGTEVETEYLQNPTDSVVNQDSVEVKLTSAQLRYYQSSHTWRKICNAYNKIRTIISDGLKFNPGGSETFKSRGVVAGDIAKITVGETIVENQVTGYEADMSVATISAVTAASGNQATQTHDVTTVDGQAQITAVDSGTYIGNLKNNVLTDTYTVLCTTGGGAPTVSFTETIAAAGLAVTTNAKYNNGVADVYRVRIVVPGALTTAKYQVTSNNGDNSSLITTGASGAENVCGSKGLTFTITGTGDLVAGEEIVISVTPSTARFSVTTESGEDEQTGLVFPGFAYPMVIGSGISLTFSVGSGSVLVPGYYWTVSADAGITAVTMSVDSDSEYTGTVDKNIFVKCIQGGEWGDAIIEVSDTSSGVKETYVAEVSPTLIDIGDGVSIVFTDNTQNGLILNDVFSIVCEASKATQYRILTLKDSLPTDFGEVTATHITPAAVPTTGSGLNKLESSGTYSSLNPALDLYNQEEYYIQISTIGAGPADAKFIVTTLSGNDDVLTETAVGAIDGGTHKSAIKDVGIYGLKVQFTITQSGEPLADNNFVLGDTWKVIVTKQNLDVDLHMVKESITLTDDKLTKTASSVTVDGSIALIDTSWHESATLPLVFGNLLLSYLSLHTVGANTILSIASTNDITTYLGEIDERNPIAQGVYNAFVASGQRNIYAMYSNSTTSASWQTMLDTLEYLGSNYIYRIVPMTHDNTIISLIIAHVNKCENKNKWREAVVCKRIDRVLTIASGTAIIEQNPNDSKYTIFTTEDANFTTVQATDSISYLGQTLTVKTVLTSTKLELLDDYLSEQLVESSFTITRVPSKTDNINAYKYCASSINNKSIVNIVPDTVDGKPGYFAAASVAGLKASVYPHQPITNLTVPGITDTLTYLSSFSEDDLNNIADSGNLIIAQDTSYDAPYIRHQLTTDPSDVRHREMSFTECVNYICYGILNICNKYHGKYNIHPGVLNQIQTELNSYFYSLTASPNEYAGPYITELTNLTVLENPNQEDGILVTASFSCPKPLNNIDVSLNIS